MGASDPHGFCIVRGSNAVIQERCTLTPISKMAAEDEMGGSEGQPQTCTAEPNCRRRAEFPHKSNKAHEF